MNENIIVPTPPSTLSSQIETGAGGVQTQISEKNSDKGVFFCFFFATIFFTVQNGRNIYRGGGGGGGAGGSQLFIIFFSFFLGGGGVWGGCKSLFL